MSDSMRDQLLKLGVATDKQARQATKDARQQQHRKSKGAKPRPSRDEVLEAKQAEARAAKAARDRELNRQREADALMKARWAEIRQLIEQHRVPKADGFDYFNFVDRGKIRRIAVDAGLRERIMTRQLAIVRCEGRYDLVPAEIGERIRERHARAVVNLDDPDSPDEGDAYRDHPVPDDLIW